MNAFTNAVTSEAFCITPSVTLFRIELALHGIVMLAILNVVEWPYKLLFLLLLGGLGWQFFHKYYMRAQYAGHCQIQWRSYPPCIRWTEAESETDYPAAQVKIRMNRWFILLQLGEGRKRVSRLLLADSFDSCESFSKCRKLMLQVTRHVS